MTPSEINRDLPEGATPLDLDEAADLLPSHIRTRGELNVWEQENWHAPRDLTQVE